MKLELSEPVTSSHTHITYHTISYQAKLLHIIHVSLPAEYLGGHAVHHPGPDVDLHKSGLSQGSNNPNSHLRINHLRINHQHHLVEGKKQLMYTNVVYWYTDYADITDIS